MSTSVTIKRGDTLSAIAKKYNSTPAQLAKMNGITDQNKIQAGKQLIVRDGFDRPAPAKSASPSVGEDARDRRDAAAVKGVGTAPNGNPPNGVARFDRYPTKGGLATGKITLNGNTYAFNSGSNSSGGGLLSTPKGQFIVGGKGPIDDSVRKAMTKDGVTFNYTLLNPKTGGDSTVDPRRPGQPREFLRIHPDGNKVGTAGCIGIVKSTDPALSGKQGLQQFQKDLEAELQRAKAAGKPFILTVE